MMVAKQDKESGMFSRRKLCNEWKPCQGIWRRNVSEGCGYGMKEWEGDEMRTWKKDFLVRSFCVYIGRCWQHRKE